MKISRHVVFTLMQKSSCAWNTDTKMSRKLNWIIKKIILYICVADLTSKMPTGHENCSLISMILSNFPRNVNYCYCCYQLRQQRRLAIMMSKCSKWNNSLCELSIIIHWEIAVNHCWKCNKYYLLSYNVIQIINYGKYMRYIIKFLKENFKIYSGIQQNKQKQSYPKNWEALPPCHTCPKDWSSPFYYLILCLTLVMLHKLKCQSDYWVFDRNSHF